MFNQLAIIALENEYQNDFNKMKIYVLEELQKHKLWQYKNKEIKLLKATLFSEYKIQSL